mgnify:FL=1
MVETDHSVRINGVLFEQAQGNKPSIDSYNLQQIRCSNISTNDRIGLYKFVKKWFGCGLGEAKAKVDIDRKFTITITKDRVEEYIQEVKAIVPNCKIEFPE